VKRVFAILAVLGGLTLRGAVPSGPNPGERVPDFRLVDQNGNQRTLRSILGPKGALLVFFRSADW
jgi:hypothetical protein